jgi:hypothetical protein
VRQAPDNYFVRVEVPPEAPPSEHGSRPPNRFDTGGRPTRRRRRRKRIDSRSLALVVLLVALGAWFAWANQRPGGVSGTINGFIEKVRGDVQDASAGPDVRHAVKYFNDQYARTGSYPVPTDADLSAAGVGIGVDMSYCGGQAVVVHSLTTSRLLLAGKDLGEIEGRQGCPASLSDPSPWKAK